MWTIFRRRYHKESQLRVLALLGVSESTLYDDLVAKALSLPMCSERDLKGWLREWSTAGRIEIQNLAPRARAPRLRSHHRVRLRPERM